MREGVVIDHFPQNGFEAGGRPVQDYAIERSHSVEAIDIPVGRRVKLDAIVGRSTAQRAGVLLYARKSGDQSRPLRLAHPLQREVAWISPRCSYGSVPNSMRCLACG
jgi:hypothetical protein